MTQKLVVSPMAMMEALHGNSTLKPTSPRLGQVALNDERQVRSGEVNSIRRPPAAGGGNPPAMSHSPFEHVSEEAKAILHSHSRRKVLAANTIVYFQDDPAHNLFIIDRGHVRLSHIMEDGSVALYAIIPQGASFGEVGAFDRMGYCDTASTIDGAELTSISLQWMDREGAPYNELRTVIARMISKRYRAHMEFARALYLPTLTARLALSIIRLLDSLGNEIRYQNKTVPVLGPVVTQRDLGAMARGTRENVNKILRAWIADGLVVVEDRHIIVTNRAKLEAIAFNM